MIFGAARVAPEKAVFRPALPMSFLPGISEMQMESKNMLPLGDFEDTLGGKYTARLEIVDGEEPTVHIFSDARNVGAFRLSAFLDPLPQEDGFRFSSGGYIDDPVITLKPLDTGYIASRALQRLSRLDGHFEVRWVPNDPALPF